MIDESGAGMKRVKRIATSLKANREDYEAEFEQLEQHFLPRRGLFSNDPTSKAASNRGASNINRKILDGVTTRSLRVLQSGMHSGLTSPSRPWFRLRPQNEDLRERGPVKEFLFRLEQESRRMAERSGLYNTLHTGYGDLGVYGHEAAIHEDHHELGLLPHQLVPGSFWLGMSGTKRVDTLYRETLFTIHQIVGMFVFKGKPRNDPDWSLVPSRIKSMYDKGDISKSEKVSQLIMPRRDRDPMKLTPQNKPFGSEYWLTTDDRPESKQTMLKVGGFNKNPISASRWDVIGADVYGISPAMDIMPDVRELMAKRRDYAELLKRLNRPPMNAHSDLRNSRFSLLPDSVNFMADPTKGLVPTYQTTPQLGPLAEDIQMSRDSVWSGMFADLFMMISQLTRRQITATEIDERREEKLLALGPVIERQHFEKLGPVIERLVGRVMEMGLVGEPPVELQGEDLEIEFVSTLAQAMKAVATGGIERFAGYVGNLAAVSPEVIDKFDVDQSVDHYGEFLGVPPDIIRSDDDVEALRQERREAEAQAQQLEQANAAMEVASNAAGAARVLADADLPRGAAPNDTLNKLGLG